MKIEALQVSASGYIESVVVYIIAVRICRVARSVVEVNSLSAIDLKTILGHRRRVLSATNRIARYDRGFSVRPSLHPLGALAVIRIGLNLSATGVITRPTLLIEVVTVRIRTYKGIVSNVGIPVQRLWVFEMSSKTIWRHEPPHRTRVVPRAEVVEAGF
jgi:hypothetical protein